MEYTGGQMIDLGKQNVLGVKIDAVDYDWAVARIIEAARQRTPLGVSALAVHGVMTGVMDDAHRYRLNNLELVVPDGQPVRWALNWLHGTGLSDRVYGPDLMLKTCQAAADEGIPVLFFGGDQPLLDLLSDSLVKKFPTLRVADTLPSKFRTISLDEKMELINAIAKSGAGITFVGLGCPRQEVWTYEFKDHLRMPVIAVGAAYSFHAGRVSQAPSFLQRIGLEWFYRLLCEPKRLSRRYVLLNPYYLTLLFCQWTGLRTFDPDKTSPPNAEILYG
jgi:exopolysaccharide biosynthesis WecB/TagA/CpsF family protein